MKKLKSNETLIENIIQISIEAGVKVLNIYKEAPTVVEIKEDSSPLTKADIESNNLIIKQLRKISSSIPILSEESADIPFAEREKWKQFWLIDPLDGTKEFLNKNGEFTINIALIENNIPIIGLIHTPVFKETYWGSVKDGSFMQAEYNQKKSIYVSNENNLPTRVLTSRSHPSNKLKNWMKDKNNIEITKMGSSLKFCQIAKGAADFYPRFGPTSEWDIAAGHAIVNYAGGDIITLENQDLRYNTKESLINPSFVVSKSKNLSKKMLSI